MINSTYSLTLFDHLLVLVFAIAIPVYGYINYRKNIALILSGELSRAVEYLRTAAAQWVLAICCGLLWWVMRRDWAELGLSFDLRFDTGFWVAVGLTALAIGVFWWQLMAIRRDDPGLIERLRGPFEVLKPLMPSSARELKAFYVLSLTAGIVEEVLYRGFLIGYLSLFLPLWLAVMLSALVFGAAHAYQGISQVPKIAVVGLLMTALYWLSGSLWLAMVAHALIDVIQGRMAFELYRRQPDVESPDSAPGQSLP